MANNPKTPLPQTLPSKTQTNMGHSQKKSTFVEREVRKNSPPNHRGKWLWLFVFWVSDSEALCKGIFPPGLCRRITHGPHAFNTPKGFESVNQWISVCCKGRPSEFGWKKHLTTKNEARFFRLMGENMGELFFVEAGSFYIEGRNYLWRADFFTLSRAVIVFGWGWNFHIGGKLFCSRVFFIEGRIFFFGVDFYSEGQKVMTKGIQNYHAFVFF